MKTKLKYTLTLTLVFSLFFIACSTDNDPIAHENPSMEMTNDDALLFEFGPQIFTDSLNLNFTIPGYIGDINTWESRVTLIFYNPSKENTTTWFPIPSINLEEDYKILYTGLQNSSESEDISVQLTVEKIGSSELFGNPINARDIRIIAVKTSALKGLTLNDLNLWDYNAVMTYFNLEED